jgi:hypothetical protein
LSALDAVGDAVLLVLFAVPECSRRLLVAMGPYSEPQLAARELQALYLKNEILMVLFMVFSPMILSFVILTCIVATSDETQSVKKCCGRLMSNGNKGWKCVRAQARASKKAPNGGTASY